MNPETPAAPPESDVIRLAREATNMTALEAAEATKSADGKGISVTYWRDVERGYGGRRGKRVTVRASARALAVMARVTGVTPERLTGAGRADAAAILEEMLRRAAEQERTLMYDVTAVERAVRELLEDPIEQAIWDQDWLTPAERVAEITGLRMVRRQRGPGRDTRDTGIEGTALPR